MVGEDRFAIIYAPEVKIHLKWIGRKYYSLIRETIEVQLQNEPFSEAKNRKPLRRMGKQPFQWEIRFGPGNRFRVFYTIDRSRLEVHILAIGEKKGNSLFIGGEEIRL